MGYDLEGLLCFQLILKASVDMLVWMKHDHRFLVGLVNLS